MKKPTPFLDFYYHHLKNSDRFTCMCGMMSVELHAHTVFQMITPTSPERILHAEAGWGVAFWGRSYKDDPKGAPGFNEFRQTVILLCAAINEEL